MTFQFEHFTSHGAYRIGHRTGDGVPKRGPPVLLVGEVNPYGVDARQALWPSPSKSSGGRLQSRILRLPHEDYYGLWRINLCTDKWDNAVADAVAGGLVPGPLDWMPHHPWHVVVCLGRRVTSAFERVLGVSIETWSFYPFWSESFIDAPDVYMSIASIPHPSGRCLAWNDPSSSERACALLRDLAPEVPWGTLGGIPIVDG